MNRGDSRSLCSILCDSVADGWPICVQGGTTQGSLEKNTGALEDDHLWEGQCQETLDSGPARLGRSS